MIRERLIRSLSARGMIAVNTVLLAMAVPPHLHNHAASRPNKPDNYPRYCAATASKLLVRSGPGRTSAVIDTVLKGHRVDVTAPSGTVETIDSLKGEWLKVKTMKGADGYAFSAYLKPLRPAPDFKDPTAFQGPAPCAGDWIACVRENEERLLRRHPSRAARVKDSLIFTADSGAKTVLADKKTGGEDHVAYQLVQYVPELRSFTVMVNFYEGGTFCLVHEKTGKKTEVFGPPILSPGKDRFVAYNCDIVAGYTANGLQVFRINRDTSVTRLAEIRKSWGPVNVRWAGNDRIVFDRLDFVEDGYISSLGEIEIAGNAYTLIE